MEPRFIALRNRITIATFLFTCIIFVGCWTNESNIQVVNTLQYHFKVIKDSQNPDAGYQLVQDIENNNASFSIIEKNCVYIVYDSSRIYTKSTLDDAASKYMYTIYRINPSNHAEYSKITDIKEADFASNVANCKDCIQVSLP